MNLQHFAERIDSISYQRPRVYVDSDTFIQPNVVIEWDVSFDDYDVTIQAVYNITHLFIQEPDRLADNDQDFYGYEEIEYEFVEAILIEDNEPDVKYTIPEGILLDDVLMQVDEDFSNLDDTFIETLKRQKEEY